MKDFFQGGYGSYGPYGSRNALRDMGTTRDQWGRILAKSGMNWSYDERYPVVTCFERGQSTRYHFRGRNLAFVELPDMTIRYDFISCRAGYEQPLAKYRNGCLVAHYHWDEAGLLVSCSDSERNHRFFFEYDRSGHVCQVHIQPERPDGHTVEMSCAVACSPIGTPTMLTGESGPYAGRVVWNGNAYAGRADVRFPLGLAGGLEDWDTGVIRIDGLDYFPRLGLFMYAGPRGIVQVSTEEFLGIPHARLVGETFTNAYTFKAEDHPRHDDGRFRKVTEGPEAVKTKLDKLEESIKTERKIDDLEQSIVRDKIGKVKSEIADKAKQKMKDRYQKSQADKEADALETSILRKELEKVEAEIESMDKKKPEGSESLTSLAIKKRALEHKKKKLLSDLEKRGSAPLAGMIAEDARAMAVPGSKAAKENSDEWKKIQADMKSKGELSEYIEYSRDAYDVISQARTEILSVAEQYGIPWEAISGALLDEYSARLEGKGVKGAWDANQDIWAPYFISIDSMKKAKPARNKWDKLLSSNWDIGPGNINVQTAFSIFDSLETGADVSSPLAQYLAQFIQINPRRDPALSEKNWTSFMKNILLNNKGNAYFAAHYMQMGLSILEPYMQGVSSQEKAAILMTWYKQGPSYVERYKKGPNMGKKPITPGEGLGIAKNWSEMEKYILEGKELPPKPPLVTI